jgi:hypothetical protein
MECESAIDEKTLRQGDIFAAHPSTENWENPWRRFGIVLSADCDLAQRKTGPTLVYVPIVGLATYLADAWLPTQAEKLRQKCVQQLDRNLQAENGSVTARHIEAWTIEQLEAALTSSRSATEERRRDQVTSVLKLRAALLDLSRLAKVKEPSGLSELDSALSQLFVHQELIANVSQPGPAHRRKIVHEALCGLGARDRLDTWPLCDLIGLDPEMREQEQFGFVVDLRRFSVLPVEKILIDKREWLRHRDSFVRICRLRGIYKADLVQKFANLFVRVGLEDRREEEHRHMFDRASKKLVPESS